MKREELLRVLKACCTDVTFDYKGMHCGIFPEVEDGIPTYSTWLGEDKNKDFKSAEELMESPFFFGKSLNDICEQVDIHDY